VCMTAIAQTQPRGPHRKRIVRRLLRLGFALFSINLVNLTVVECNITPTAPIEQPPLEVRSVVSVPNAQDLKGNPASYKLFILVDEYRWALGRTDLLESGHHDAFPFSQALTQNSERRGPDLLHRGKLRGDSPRHNIC
jgi:hypothetical protein